MYTTSKILYRWVRNSFAASCIRNDRMYSTGDNPVSIFTFLYTNERLMFSTSASSLILKSDLSRIRFQQIIYSMEEFLVGGIPVIDYVRSRGFHEQVAIETHQVAS